MASAVTSIKCRYRGRTEQSPTSPQRATGSRHQAPAPRTSGRAQLHVVALTLARRASKNFAARRLAAFALDAEAQRLAAAGLGMIGKRR